MKKNMNVIKIKGIKGLIMAGFIACCLFAGFAVFPGWIAMQAWDFVSARIDNLPAIGLLQGMLLWGIIAASYFIFRKDRVVVCMSSQEGLSDEELKAIFKDIKKQSQDDLILQSMLKAREAELSYKAQQELDKKDVPSEESIVTSESSNS